MRYCKKKKWISADDFELIVCDVKIPTYVTDSEHKEKVKEQMSLTCTETTKMLKKRFNFWLTFIFYRAMIDL